jgi:hypothetical protein
MKKLLISAAIAAACVTATPVFAQDGGTFSPTTFYGNLGYTGYSVDFGGGKTTLAALGGRLGARFGKYVGGEGEVGFGVNSQHVSGVDVKMTSSYAGYLVGYIPASPHLDLFGRVGYGHENLRATTGGVSVTDGNNTVNFGGGGQYFFTDKDGVRVEYTRFQHATSNDGDADTWSITYVRKF